MTLQLPTSTELLCQGIAEAFKEEDKIPLNSVNGPVEPDLTIDQSIPGGRASSAILGIAEPQPVGSNVSRQGMIDLLNEDLAGEYQAIIAYVVYSQVLKGAAYTDIARELQAHAGEELAHAIKIAKQIDYLGGMPGVVPKAVLTSNDPTTMLRADLENERVTVGRYRERIRQAEAMGEFALSETLRAIIVQEQEHEIDLASALGIEVPAA